MLKSCDVHDITDITFAIKPTQLCFLLSFPNKTTRKAYTTNYR